MISTPNYPNDYGNNLDCSWNIEVPSGFLVLLQVELLHSEVVKDYFEVILCQRLYLETLIKIPDGKVSIRPTLKQIV